MSKNTCREVRVPRQPRDGVKYRAALAPLWGKFSRLIRAGFAQRSIFALHQRSGQEWHQDQHNRGRSGI